MANRVRLSLIIQLVVIVIVFCVVGGILLYYQWFGVFNFNSNNVVSIFGSIIQGMSALLAVAITVIIFRIQSLENRNYSLEQSTLNYIHNRISWDYPDWIPKIEENIRNGRISNRYYRAMRDLCIKQGRIKEDLESSKEVEQRLIKDRDNQQERLEQTLNIHIRINQTIQRIRKGVISSLIMLVFPIIISFLMLMASDALNAFQSLMIVSVVVVTSAIGIVVLVNVILESMVQNN